MWPTDIRQFVIRRLWSSALLKFTIAILLQIKMLSGLKRFVFKTVFVVLELMVLKAELKKTCYQVCNLYRLFMYYSCAAISVVIHRGGEVMIFYQTAILLFSIMLPVRSPCTVASAAVQKD